MGGFFFRQARGDRNSLLCSPGACSVDQTGLKLTETHLPPTPIPGVLGLKVALLMEFFSLIGDHAKVKCTMFNDAGIGRESCESNSNAR